MHEIILNEKQRKTLREIRKNRKITGCSLSQYVGEDASWCCNIETGRTCSIALNNLQKMCEKLSCSIQDVLGYDPDTRITYTDGITCSELNEAGLISISFSLLGESIEIKINKNQNTIRSNGKNITGECLKMLNENPEDDTRGGVVFAKMLQSNTDVKCLRFLHDVLHDT